DTVTFADRAHVEAMRERIDEAIERHRAHDQVVFDSKILARDGRSASEWVSFLRTVAERETFRQTGVSPDDLFRIVEDAAAATVTRAAAAVALTPHLDEPGRVRLAAVADTTVAPRLRVAIDAVAKDDPEAMAQNLDELEREQHA